MKKKKVTGYGWGPDLPVVDGGTEVEIESIRKMLARAADTGHSN